MTPMQTIRAALDLGVEISNDEYSGTCIHEDEHMPIFKAAYAALASLEFERPKLPRAMLNEIYASGFEDMSHWEEYSIESIVARYGFAIDDTPPPEAKETP